MFTTAWALPKFLPEVIQRQLYWCLATAGFIVRTSGVKRLQFNMSRVVSSTYWSPKVLLLTWKAVHSYFKYWQQMFAMHSRDTNYVLAHSETENKEILDAALAKGRGALVVSTHSGNWDMAGAWLGLTYGNVVTVAEKLEPYELFEMFVDARKKFNVTIYPHISSDSTVDSLSHELSNNNIVGLVVDRTLSPRGIPVKLFGNPCKLPVGPYAISQANNVDIIPGAIWFDGTETRMKLFNPISSASKSAEMVMQEVADVFESMISLHPENWHMFQQVWPDHPRKWGGR
jgi:lauroyl/myristoyl acyltransferase